MDEQEIRNLLQNFLKEPFYSIVYEYCKTSHFAETHSDLKKNEIILECFLHVGEVIDKMMHIDMPLEDDFYLMCSIGRQAYWRDIVASMVIIILDNNNMVNDCNRKDYDFLKRRLGISDFYGYFVHKQKQNRIKEYKGDVKKIGLTIEQLRMQCEKLKPQERKDFLLRYKTDYEQAKFELEKNVVEWIEKELEYLSCSTENSVDDGVPDENQEEVEQSITPSLLYNIDFLKVLIKASLTKSKSNSTMYVTSDNRSYSWNGTKRELVEFAKLVNEYGFVKRPKKTGSYSWLPIQDLFNESKLAQCNNEETYKDTIETLDVIKSMFEGVLKDEKNSKL